MHKSTGSKDSKTAPQESQDNKQQSKSNEDMAAVQDKKDTPVNHKCDQCGMLFTSADGLATHKKDFCLGTEDSGINRNLSQPINSKYAQNNRLNDDNQSLRDNNFDDNFDDNNNNDDNYNDPIDNPNTDNVSFKSKNLSLYSTRPFGTPNDQINYKDPNKSNTQLNKNIFSLNRSNTKLVISKNENNKSSLSNKKSLNNNNENDASNTNIRNGYSIINKSNPNLSRITLNNQMNNSNTTLNRLNDPNNLDKNDLTPRNQINDSNTNLNQNKALSAINELKNYKNKKSLEQSLQDLEDTLVRDTIRDKKLVTSLNNMGSSTNVKESENSPNDSDPYKKLLKEYGELKKKEKQILQEVYEYNPNFRPIKIGGYKDNDTHKHDFLSLFDFDDIDLDYLDSVSLADFPSGTMNDDTRLNLRRIQERTEELERERREIQYKIEALKNNTSYPLAVQSSQSVNRVLSELRDQQRINEAALNMLRQRLVNDSPSLNNNNLRSNPTSGIFPPIYTNTNQVAGLSSALYESSNLSPEEIRLMRLNYLQSGGHDQSVLNRFTEMEYNARFKGGTNSFSNSRTSRPLVAYDTDIDNKIKKIDLENKRLQAELESLQDKYQTLSNGNMATFDMLKKYTDINLPPIRQTPVLNGNSYQTNRPIIADQTLLAQRSNNNSQYRSQSNFATQKLARLKDLPPAPYDPNGGFVLFIDFVTNIDPTYACARAITCLHHPKSGLGEPSVLPIVNCETYVEDGSQTSVALISTKQPVPRCPPQQALTILIEIQMALKDGSETRLKSCAWTKIPLFDSKNRLLSGRWKCVLKNLPIKSETSISNLGSVPEFGYTELYYRLVNLRDSEEQTNAPISPAYADQYSPMSQRNIKSINSEYTTQPNDQDFESNFDDDIDDHLLENHKNKKAYSNRKTSKKSQDDFYSREDDYDELEKKDQSSQYEKIWENQQNKAKSKYSKETSRPNRIIRRWNL